MKKKADNKVNKFIYWIPRIMSIIFILFLSLFSLDVFGQGYGLWGTLLAFLMHNIPVFILTALLIFAWKYEIVGAIVFFLVGLLYIFMTLVRTEFEWFLLAWCVQISGPAFVIGALFLTGWLKKR